MTSNAEAMRLVFKSAVHNYGPTDDKSVHRGEIDDWEVVEHFDPTPLEGFPDHVGCYWLTLETDVVSREDLSEKSHRAFEIVDELDRAWVYGCGRPFLPVHRELVLIEAPEGWSGNTPEVEREMVRREGGLLGETKIISRHWQLGSHLPLEHVLSVLDKYRSAARPVRALIDLHYDALKSTEEAAKLILLAKGLELGRVLMPGRSQQDKARAISEKVGTRLKRSVGWLFDVANNRLDIRHVVLDPDGPVLHQELSGEEHFDFCHDADIVLRSIVSQLLEVPTVFYEEGG